MFGDLNCSIELEIINLKRINSRIKYLLANLITHYNVYTRDVCVTSKILSQFTFSCLLSVCRVLYRTNCSGDWLQSNRVCGAYFDCILLTIFLYFSINYVCSYYKKTNQYKITVFSKLVFHIVVEFCQLGIRTNGPKQIGRYLKKKKIIVLLDSYIILEDRRWVRHFVHSLFK